METSSTHLIVTSLTKAIVEHRLHPGTKLAEQKLADHFGVSIASLVGEAPDEGSDEEQLLVMYRDLKSLDPKDRELLEDIIKGMQKRRDGG